MSLTTQKRTTPSQPSPDDSGPFFASNDQKSGALPAKNLFFRPQSAVMRQVVSSASPVTSTTTVLPVSPAATPATTPPVPADGLANVEVTVELGEIDFGKTGVKISGAFKIEASNSNDKLRIGKNEVSIRKEGNKLMVDLSTALASWEDGKNLAPPLDRIRVAVEAKLLDATSGGLTGLKIDLGKIIFKISGGWDIVLPDGMTITAKFEGAASLSAKSLDGKKLLDIARHADKLLKESEVVAKTLEELADLQKKFDGLGPIFKKNGKIVSFEKYNSYRKANGLNALTREEFKALKKEAQALRKARGAAGKVLGKARRAIVAAERAMSRTAQKLKGPLAKYAGKLMAKTGLKLLGKVLLRAIPILNVLMLVWDLAEISKSLYDLFRGKISFGSGGGGGGGQDGGPQGQQGDGSQPGDGTSGGGTDPNAVGADGQGDAGSGATGQSGNDAGQIDADGGAGGKAGKGKESGDSTKPGGPRTSSTGKADSSDADSTTPSGALSPTETSPTSTADVQNVDGQASAKAGSDPSQSPPVKAQNYNLGIQIDDYFAKIDASPLIDFLQRSQIEKIEDVKLRVTVRLPEGKYPGVPGGDYYFYDAFTVVKEGEVDSMGTHWTLTLIKKSPYTTLLRRGEAPVSFNKFPKRLTSRGVIFIFTSP